MEDYHAIKFVKKDDRDYEFAYFGIFDGHGGPEASRFARDNLLSEITKYDQFWTDNDEDIMFSIRSGFLDTHQAMWKELGEYVYIVLHWHEKKKIQLLRSRRLSDCRECVAVGKGFIFATQLTPRFKQNFKTMWDFLYSLEQSRRHDFIPVDFLLPHYIQITNRAPFPHLKMICW